MKISSLLVVSLAANVALAVYLAVAPSDASAPVPSAAATAADARATPAAASVSAESSASEAWSLLQTDNLSTQRDRLQAEGFPPATIRAILAAQIHEGFAARRKAIETARGETPFWKTEVPDPKTRAALRALGKEEQNALKDLLGPDPESGAVAALQRQLPNFPADKVAEIVAIRDNYDQQRADFYAGQNGMATTQADRDKLAALDKGLHAELATILAPHELEDYDLRTGNVASNLRSNLVAFDPTEQEFRTLFRLQQAFNDRVGPQSGLLSAEDAKARSDAQKQLNDEIKAALGDVRYAEYQRATDYSYRQLSQLVARLELPAETGNQVYALQQDMQQRIRTLQLGAALPPADRNEQLGALASEAQAKVTSLLGTRGYEAYKQNGGSWLQQLQPRPLPTTAPRP